LPLDYLRNQRLLIFVFRCLYFVAPVFRVVQHNDEIHAYSTRTTTHRCP